MGCSTSNTVENNNHKLKNKELCKCKEIEKKYSLSKELLNTIDKLKKEKNIKNKDNYYNQSSLIPSDYEIEEEAEKIKELLNLSNSITEIGDALGIKYAENVIKTIYYKDLKLEMDIFKEVFKHNSIEIQDTIEEIMLENIGSRINCSGFNLEDEMFGCNKKVVIFSILYSLKYNSDYISNTTAILIPNEMIKDKDITNSIYNYICCNNNLVSLIIMIQNQIDSNTHTEELLNEIFKAVKYRNISNLGIILENSICSEEINKSFNIDVVSTLTLKTLAISKLEMNNNDKNKLLKLINDNQRSLKLICLDYSDSNEECLRNICFSIAKLPNIEFIGLGINPDNKDITEEVKKCIRNDIAKLNSNLKCIGFDYIEK